MSVFLNKKYFKRESRVSMRSLMLIILYRTSEKIAINKFQMISYKNCTSFVKNIKFYKPL